jgi:ABC-2 type transport system ATP-binding protein
MTTAALPHPEFVIDLQHVAKVYRGKVHALRGIEMRVGRGEIFGLLGPNGAGKSTLVKILMTVIRASRCDGSVLGRPAGDKPTLGRIGYLPEHHRFPDYLTGAQVLDHFGAMANVPRSERRKRAGELLSLVGMSEWARTRVKGYSKGMRQRIGIAQALMNDPDLVVLDEPTDGVDPVGRRDIRNVLQEMKQRGKTVFLNSHLLSELEMVCDRVAILVQGVVASQGTIDELTRNQRRFDIEVAFEGDTTAMLASLPPVLSGGVADTGAPDLARRVGFRGALVTGESVEVSGSTIRIATDNPVPVQPVVDALRARGVVIRSLRPVRPSLEDLFMRAVTDPTTGEILKPGADRRPGPGGNGGGA